MRGFFILAHWRYNRLQWVNLTAYRLPKQAKFTNPDRGIF